MEAFVVPVSLALNPFPGGRGALRERLRVFYTGVLSTPVCH